MSMLKFLFLGVCCITSTEQQPIESAVQQPMEKESSSRKDTWIVFSPQDSSFRLELPGKPITAKKFDTGREDETGYFRCTKSLLEAYTLSGRQGQSELNFVLGTFDVSGCRRTKRDFTKGTKRLVEVLVADDPTDHILYDQSFKVKGYPGRIFVVKISTSGYSWQMFVEANQRMYWLSYFTNDPEGESSTEAKRIFHSFIVKRP